MYLFVNSSLIKVLIIDRQSFCKIQNFFNGIFQLVKKFFNKMFCDEEQIAGIQEFLLRYCLTIYGFNSKKCTPPYCNNNALINKNLYCEHYYHYYRPFDKIQYCNHCKFNHCGLSLQKAAFESMYFAFHFGCIYFQQSLSQCALQLHLLYAFLKGGLHFLFSILKQ